MGSQRRDGSILSTALTGSQHRRAVELDYGLYRCMVVQIYYTDDENNLTFDNKQVTYDVIILGGRKEGQNIVNVKALSQGGGQYNYYERIYRATEFKFSGDGKKSLSEHNGDIVYVQYTNGNTSLPVITGAGTSTLDKDKTGATAEDGHRFIKEYNGIRETINKDGNLTLERFGGTWNAEAGYFKPDEEVLITESYTEEKIERKFKSGLTITEDGAADKLTIAMASGTIIDVDGAGGMITLTADGGNQIIIDKGGEMTIKASSKVKIEAPLVDVGESAAFSVTLAENLMSEFMKHTHNAPQAPSGTLPTSPPLVPLISLVGSTTVKVKD